MTKIVIVDDEILIRVGIKSSLNWEEHGFKIVGQAEDGIKALEVVKQTHPDIVLTDLKMPKMDGLELIRELKKQYPAVKIVVLSCLNEIDYVKKAMKYGAEDYILKLSIEPESLLEILTKVRQTMESEPQIRGDAQSAEAELEQGRNLLKENIYQKMVEGSIGYEVFAKRLSVFGVDLNSGTFLVLCGVIDDYSSAPVRSEIGDRYLLKFSFLNILEEILSGNYDCDIAEIEEGKYLILLKYDDAQESAFRKDALSVHLGKINDALKKYLNITISLGVDTLPAEGPKIRDSFLKAREAAEYRFYRGRESVNFCDESPGFMDCGIHFDGDDEKRLLQRLDYFDQSGVKEIVDGFFDRVIASQNLEPATVKHASLDIYNDLLNFVKRFGSRDKLVFPSPDVHPVDFLRASETVYDIRNWLDRFIDEFYEYIFSQEQEEKRPEIVKLQKYIAENIGENITLEKASKISNISKCYLSSIFKKETGDTFVDYVNKTKMEAAKNLIQQNRLKIYKVAEAVGISDVSYFSKLFKKYIGISPSEIEARRER